MEVLRSLRAVPTRALVPFVFLMCGAASASAQQGKWKIEVGYTGSATTSQSYNPAGAPPVITSTLNFPGIRP